MNRLRPLLFAVASVPLLIHAQPARVPAAVTDANATVAPLQYHSAFAGYQSIPNSKDTPDKLWGQANRDVWGEYGHDTHGAAPMPMPMTPTPAAVSKPEVAPTVEPHQDHHMHKKGQ